MKDHYIITLLNIIFIIFITSPVLFPVILRTSSKFITRFQINQKAGLLIIYGTSTSINHYHFDQQFLNLQVKSKLNSAFKSKPCYLLVCTSLTCYHRLLKFNYFHITFKVLIKIILISCSHVPNYIILHTNHSYP